MVSTVAQKKILLTGRPGCGKSTVIEKLIRRIDAPCTGFFTREMRNQGRRVGFSITTLEGRRGIMAHIDMRSKYRVGKYKVDLQSIDRLAVPSMMPQSIKEIVVIDEIGRMECLSARFRQTLDQVLDSSNRVVGTIALKGDTFISAIKARPDTLVIPVSEKNRQTLAHEILRLL